MNPGPDGRPSTRRVMVDHDLCIGSGECVRLQPDAFQLDEHSGVSDALAGADALSDAERGEVMRNCPMGAISVLGSGPDL